MIHKLSEERHNHWKKMSHDWNIDRAVRVMRLEKLLEDAYAEKRKLRAQGKS